MPLALPVYLVTLLLRMRLSVRPVLQDVQLAQTISLVISANSITTFKMVLALFVLPHLLASTVPAEHAVNAEMDFSVLHPVRPVKVTVKSALQPLYVHSCTILTDTCWSQSTVLLTCLLFVIQAVKLVLQLILHSAQLAIQATTSLQVYVWLALLQVYVCLANQTTLQFA